MLKKRIIPCLDIAAGRTVKGVNFIELQDAGDPVELAARYARDGADELVFLDITATVESRETFTELVTRIANRINIPFTVGGGIRTSGDIARLLRAGADKVSINSAAVAHPGIITDMSSRFGSQCIVVAIDARREDRSWQVYTHGGRKRTDLDAVQWARRVVELGAGEILLTSMDHDGVKQGFAVELTNTVCAAVNVPVIASGGAGNQEHYLELFLKSQADAGLAASIFHYNEVSIPSLKSYLKDNQIPIR